MTLTEERPRTTVATDDSVPQASSTVPREPPPAPLNSQTVGPGAALSLFLAGALVLGFVLFAFGFSDLSEARTQKNMIKSFTKALGEATAPVGPATEGNPVAVLDIPAIGIHNMAVVEGTSSRDLMSGPGHVPSTVLPGQAGTSSIFGKQSTFGSPFKKLLDLQPGDIITVYTGQAANTYKVSSFGDRERPPPANSSNRLVLWTAKPGWWPNSYNMVSADLTSPVQDAPGGLPMREKSFDPMARDNTDSVIPFAGWSLVLLALAFVATALLQLRAYRWPVILCVAAVTSAVLWNVYENAAGLLPNLM